MPSRRTVSLMLFKVLIDTEAPSRSSIVSISESSGTNTPAKSPSGSPVEFGPGATICKGRPCEAAITRDVMLEKPKSKSPAWIPGTMAATLGFLQIDFEAMFLEHAFFNTQVQWCYIHNRYNADVYFSQFAGFCSLVGIVVRAAAGAQHY